MKSYTIKENYVGSEVGEILRHIHTHIWIKFVLKENFQLNITFSMKYGDMH